MKCRSVAQSGSAPRSGRGGRRFKSCHSDHQISKQVRVFFPRAQFTEGAPGQLSGQKPLTPDPLAHACLGAARCASAECPQNRFVVRSRLRFPYPTEHRVSVQSHPTACALFDAFETKPIVGAARISSAARNCARSTAPPAHGHPLAAISIAIAANKNPRTARKRPLGSRKDVPAP